MIGSASDVSRTVVRMAASFAVATLGAWLVARVGLQPASVIPPAVAVAAVAVLFALHPADGLGVFLLFSLTANTLQVWLHANLYYFDELGLLALAVVAFTRHHAPNGRQRVGIAEGALVIVVVTGIISSLLKGVPLGIWGPGLLLLMKGVAFLYLVMWLPLRAGDVLRAGTVLVSSATLLLLLGFVELFDPVAFERTLGLPYFRDIRGGLTVIKSVFLHPAIFGWLTVFASLFLYAAVLLRRTMLLLPVALLFSIGSFFSGRRTAILGLLLAITVGLFWYWRHSGSPGAALRRWAPLAGGVVLLVVAFVPFVGDFYVDTPGAYLDTPSAITAILAPNPDASQIAQVQPRTALYVGSLAIARDDFPFGAGLGRYGSYMSRLDYSPVYASYGMDRIPGLSRSNPTAIDDTFWPSVLGETGALGLVAYAVFIGAIFVRLWRSAENGRDGWWQVVALGTILVFAQGLVASLTAGTYVAPPIAFFIFGTAGATLAVAATNERGAAHAAGYGANGDPAS